MRAYTPGLYGTLISSVETHSITNPKLVDQSTFTLWRDRLGHPGKTMMYRIIENSNGHPLKDLMFLVKGDFICSACSLGKLITKPSMTKVNLESLMFLERIQGDICGPITPSCGPFKYFMVFIDASTHWSHATRRIHRYQKVTKSHISAENVPTRLEVPEVTLTQTKASESQIRRKRGRPLGSKDANPRKRKEHIVSINHDANVTTSNVSEDKIPEVILPEDPKRNEKDLDDSYEMSINYANNSLGLYRKEIKINDIFAYYVAVEIMDEDDNDPQTMEECQHRNDWKSWKKAIQDELDSLNKREVFGPIIPTPKGVKPVGYKWVFVRKRNEQNEVVRYKARLVAQGFTQKPGIDYTEIYSPVVDATTLRFLISLSVIEQLKMQLMDVVTAYLYGSLDTNIYMRIPEGLKMPKALKSKPRYMYSIKLKRSLYGLKQSGHMWYNRLSEYLIKKGFCHNQISPCLFIKRTESGFVIIAVYVDDLHIIGSPEEIRQSVDYLKSEFEMKDLGTTKYCLGLQFEHTKGGIFIHQSNYIEKVLERFHMNNAHPLSTPMVVRSLDVNKDSFRPPTHNDEILGPKVPYLSAIGALMYLANNTRPDIAFSVNLLARYSSTPTKRHWNGVKHILRYLRGTSDMGLYFERHENAKATNLVGYSDAGYLSDSHKTISQSGYVFMYGGTAISWRSTKQTLVATSSNHAELIALYELDVNVYGLDHSYIMFVNRVD
ncbi:UNVERIFIED_CONTAM: Retrovirus-related Pol polyprotein from transposon TNT 1-94 [Sesamum radiatum]|uniref:Retrovirus-related Pol polyprotein from transposon TNT 1-94 n=1 Tax=Sesamum radiatum TaxID=300843 RepID=A0AAW2M5P0_SESRA